MEPALQTFAISNSSTLLDQECQGSCLTWVNVRCELHVVLAVQDVCTSYPCRIFNREGCVAFPAQKGPGTFRGWACFCACNLIVSCGMARLNRFFHVKFLRIRRHPVKCVRISMWRWAPVLQGEMKIHQSLLFLCSPQGTRVLTHPNLSIQSTSIHYILDCIEP